tara:strand:- start:210 stop:878 length:669 start_codon:yes stop_codon:yes gene_type:complete
MNHFIFILGFFISNSLFFIGSTSSAESFKLFRATIGIKIHYCTAPKSDRLLLCKNSANWQNRKAKVNDRLRSGDQLSVYVKPEENSFVYLVNSNAKTASLIALGDNQNNVSAHSLRVLPSIKEGYEVDGNEDIELFSIICSSKKLPRINQLFSGGSVKVEKWRILEKKFFDDSQIITSSKPEEQLQFGGSIRGLDSKPFIKTLSMSSGKALIVRRYQFDVKK